MTINYQGRIFASKVNSLHGDVDAETRFYYHQKDMYLWGHYNGGTIKTGVLLGQVLEDSHLHFKYWHYDQKGNFKQGYCHSSPTILKDGRIQLQEHWQWTTGDQEKGQSIIEEIKIEGV
ncbi:MAG: hypothetical protein OEQ53_05985 [Saprospiraceae bacterium]|nr:hypothetical protein [Saprospiraceae bacterium]